MTINIKSFLANNFVFWGPIGNLIPILYMIPSFRFYYIFIVCGALLVLGSCNLKMLKHIIIVFPMLIYMFFSSSYCYIYNEDISGMGENPISRFFLLLSFILFIIYVYDYIFKLNIDEQFKFIFLYIKGYAVSLFAGYIIMIGFYMGFINMELIKKIEVLPQMGYGLLRFSPGSYANEYGIVSSFVLSILTLILMRSKSFLGIESIELCMSRIKVLFILTFVALFLTTTRAAYIAYMFSFIYILLYRTNMFFAVRKLFTYVIVFFFIGFYIDSNIFCFSDILILGIESIADKDASAYERIYAAQSGIEAFYDSMIIGTGYGSMPYLHNVYLEFLFELGIVGCFLLILTLIYLFYGKKNRIKNVFWDMVTNIGVLHVIWFAASNHNLNHHLTWFVILLLCIKYS